MPKPRKGQPGPITLQCQAGHEAFTNLARRFFRQCSQPRWMKLAMAATGDRVLHSSQIANFSDGTLLYPAPKVFVAMGQLNQAIAAGTLPQTLVPAGGLKPMVLPDGTVLDAVGMFQVFSGALQFDAEPEREIPAAVATPVAVALGRYLRQQFGSQGIDFAVGDRDRLVQAAPVLDQLLAGKGASGELVLRDLEAIAGLLGCSADDLWDVVQEAIEAATR
jgi:hypothetical protein